MSAHADVIIIGGGVAGSAAATWLAWRGVRVTLLEKTHVAHHKVCGEYINPEAQYYMRALGFDPYDYGAVAIDRLRLFRGMKCLQAELPLRGLSLSRRILDEALLNHAWTEGADIRRGVNVSGLSTQNGQWCVHAGKRTFTGDAVFLASGKHDLRGWHRRRCDQDDLIGFKMHFRLSPIQAEHIRKHVELHLFDGGYAGLEPIEAGLANFCLVVSKERYHECGKSWDRLQRLVADRSPMIIERLSGATPGRAMPWTIYGIPYGFIAKDGPPGLYRLGDQMAVIPSFCGSGIAIALLTAYRAVESYCGDRGDYCGKVSAELAPRIRQASFWSRMVTGNVTQAGFFSACQYVPGFLDSGLRRFGDCQWPGT